MTKQELLGFIYRWHGWATNEGATDHDDNAAYAEIEKLLTDEPLGEHRTGCDSNGYVNRSGFLVCSGCGRTAGEIFQAAHERASEKS